MGRKHGKTTHAKEIDEEVKLDVVIQLLREGMKGWVKRGKDEKENMHAIWM